VIVIPRNTPLPARVKERFVTKMENQRSVVVQVLEGESSTPSDCTAIGRTSLRDLPSGLPAGWPVEITYEYETNGRLKVAAVVPGTQRDIKLELEREGSLSDERLAKWKQVVSTDGGMDTFADMIANELKLRKDVPDFVPVANAEHVMPATAAPAGPTTSKPAMPAAPVWAAPTAPSSPTILPASTMSAPTATAPTAVRPVPLNAPPANAVAATAPAPSPAVWSHPVAPRPAPASPPAPTISPVTAKTTSAPPRKQSSASMVTFVGFGISAVVGLILGYYILCYINPKGNFLDLPPDMFPWKIEAPAPESGRVGEGE
jgi:hypothetical protein